MGVGLQACRSWREGGRILEVREEIVMSQEEPLHRAVEDDDFDVLVSFQRRDDFVELRNGFRAEDVEGRVIERHAPIRGRVSRQKNLPGRVAHFAAPFRCPCLPLLICRAGYSPGTSASCAWPIAARSRRSSLPHSKITFWACTALTASSGMRNSPAFSTYTTRPSGDTLRIAPNSSPPSDTNVWYPTSILSSMIRPPRLRAAYPSGESPFRPAPSIR